MPPLSGRVIAGRYDLKTPIGRGAMGVVWRAHDRLLDREVAVKEVVISALISADERRNAYQRTLREARTAARLSHRGVVAIYDVVEEDSRPWIIMELVPSQSLDQVLVVEGRLAPGRAGRIGQQLLSALAAAHVAGVLHRDVKPSNVLIASSKIGEGWDERAVLTDFGIAQFEGDPRLTQTGMVMGSPGFTAPERIRGSDATPASDLWSLGATIYAAVEGHGPYEGRGGAITTMSAIINEDAPLAPHAGPLAPVIAALLRRDPLARPSAALAARMFAQALPKLMTAGEEPRRPTAKSQYVPSPAAPVASAPVTPGPGSGRDTAPPGEKAAAGKEEPAEVEQAGETPAAQAPVAEGPAGREAGEGAPSAEEAAKAPAVETPGEADADESALEPEASPAAAEAKPAAEEAGAKIGEAGAKIEVAAKADPAAETAKFAASVLESASVPVPGPPSAEAPAAEFKAAAAALLNPSSGGEEAAARSVDTVVPRIGADTVVPRKGSAEQPTRVPTPRARSAPSAPAAAQPNPPVAGKPERPKPTFTAAKPADRPGPSFSAASPARPATMGRPTPPRTDAPGKLVPPPSRGGTKPLSVIGRPYRPQSGQAGQGAQYAGPSQPPPDLSRQYPPGSGGGQGKHSRQGQGRKAMWVVLAVLVAAAVGVGAALGLSHDRSPGGATNAADTLTAFKPVNALNNPSTVLPGRNWTTRTVTKADVHSAAAGFSIDLPPSWTQKQQGLKTDFDGPGNLLLAVDLAQQNTSDMLAAEKQVKKETLSTFPGYKQHNLQAEPVRHAEGAVWKFSWTPVGGVQVTADDIFFAQSTPGGVQDYAIFIRSPSSTFSGSALSVFDEILRTFQVVS